MSYKTCALLFAIFMALANIAYAADNPNFTGKWTIDKSKALPQGTVSEQTLVISNSAAQMTIENSLVTPAFGKFYLQDSYAVDGKEAGFVWKRPNGQEGVGKRTAKWSDDGKNLLISQEALFDGPTGPVTFQLTQTWSLSADGNTLTIDGVLKVLPFTTLPSKSVYTKVS